MLQSLHVLNCSSIFISFVFIRLFITPYYHTFPMNQSRRRIPLWWSSRDILLVVNETRKVSTWYLRLEYLKIVHYVFLRFSIAFRILIRCLSLSRFRYLPRRWRSRIYVPYGKQTRYFTRINHFRPKGPLKNGFMQEKWKQKENAIFTEC